MRVLLTGSSGWLGRFLAPRLRAAGHVAIGLDVAPGAETNIIGSVAERPWVERIFSEQGIDAVVHTAHSISRISRATRRAPSLKSM
jgi:UDP-glucose 4-epimerase